MIAARLLHRRGTWAGPAADTLTLTYEARLLRRRRMDADGGLSFLVDLPAATSLDDGDALDLGDGRLIAVVAAAEPLLDVRGPLPRLAWHVGNRHAPCRIEPHRLLVRAEPVLRDLLARLGASLVEIEAPFEPEGGAYGRGRTMGHSPAPAAARAHDHAHDHGHAHDHPHDHARAHDHAHPDAGAARGSHDG